MLCLVTAPAAACVSPGRGLLEGLHLCRAIGVAWPHVHMSVTKTLWALAHYFTVGLALGSQASPLGTGHWARTTPTTTTDGVSKCANSPPSPGATDRARPGSTM